MKNAVNISTFFDQWSLFLGWLGIFRDGVVIVGDTNFQIEDKYLNLKRFHSFFNVNNFVQCVSSPTHVAGHTLDSVVTSDAIIHSDQFICKHLPSSTLLLGFPNEINSHGNLSCDHLEFPSALISPSVIICERDITQRTSVSKQSGLHCWS